MAGWPVADPATPAAITGLFETANQRLGALPDAGWASLSDVAIMEAAFPEWHVVAAGDRAEEAGVAPRLLLQHGIADRWLLITGAGERLCSTRAERPDRPYRLVAHPRYHRAWTGSFDEVMEALCSTTPPAGWHRLPLWLARTVALHGIRARATRGEREVAARASEQAAAAWTMHHLTARR